MFSYKRYKLYRGNSGFYVNECFSSQSAEIREKYFLRNEGWFFLCNEICTDQGSSYSDRNDQSIRAGIPCSASGFCGKSIRRRISYLRTSSIIIRCRSISCHYLSCNEKIYQGAGQDNEYRCLLIVSGSYGFCIFGIYLSLAVSSCSYRIQHDCCCCFMQHGASGCG